MPLFNGQASLRVHAVSCRRLCWQAQYATTRQLLRGMLHADRIPSTHHHLIALVGGLLVLEPVVCMQHARNEVLGSAQPGTLAC